MPGAAKSRPRRAAEDLPTLALLAAMYALLGANFALHAWRPLPLPVHVGIAALAIHLAFTVWHEAVHRNVSPRPWLNTAVGILGMFPYMTPYFMQRWIHLQHHARLNEPDDTNSVYVDGPFWTLFGRYPRAPGYARQLLARDPRTPGERLSDLLSLVAVGALFGLINIGLVILTALGWANPQQAASLNTFLSDRGWMDIAVALIGSMLVGVIMILMAYFNDFLRGYYIAIMAALAVFLIIWLNQPIYPILLGLMIVLPGIVLFIRFLSKYPLPKQEAFHG